MFVSWDDAKKFDAKYPSLSRDTGAGILELIWNAAKPVPLQDESEFAIDSLFCEWAWIIDLDVHTFEAYKGFNKTPVPVGQRFANLPRKTSRSGGDYYPIKLVRQWKLSDLPSETEFLTWGKNLIRDAE